ncbi:uncharacterized protein LOC127462516 [Manacus candei]|uniref:uncharacterized protein LOC127462516 n=1 Tax=Manacus candei TaxID=415023 RepID=UPI0022273FE8|nr:uncharacterized protein LOC127462516 [Manacus candei]
MGAAVSAIERATVDGLLSVVKRTGHTLPRAELVDFLYWCRRRGLLTSSDQLFDIEHWEKIGSELWQSVQNGQKGSKQMAQIFRIVREMIQQVHADAEIATALQKALDCSTQPKEKGKDEEGKDSCSTLIDWEAKSDPPPSYPPLAAPMFRGEFEDLIPPWTPNEISAGTAAAPSAPPPPEAMEVDPAKVPLPEDGKTSPQNPLVDELRLQREQMAKLLGAMQEIDSKGGKGKMWELYEKAAKAVQQGIQNIEEQLNRHEVAEWGGREGIKQAILQRRLTIAEGQQLIQRLLGAHEGLTTGEKEQLQRAVDEGREEIDVRRRLPFDKRGTDPFDRRGADGARGPPRDDSFDPTRRWKGQEQPRWIPARWVKPWLSKVDAAAAENSDTGSAPTA